MDREELIDRICPTDATYECGQVGCSSNCEKCEEVLNALLNKYDKQIRADAIDDFQEWLKTQVVGIDNSTQEILVAVDNRWELAIEKYKEQKNGNDRRRNG